MLQILKKTDNTISSGFSIGTEDKNRILNILPIVVAYFAGVSGLLCLSELTRADFNPILTTLTILLIPCLCIRWKWATLVLSSLVLVAGTFIVGNDGFLYLLNQIILQYNTITASEISYFTLGGSITVSLYFFETVFLAFFVSYMYVLIHGKHWIQMLFVSVFMDAVMIYLLRENSIIYLVFSTMSLLGCFVYCQKINEDTRLLSGGLVCLSVVFVLAGLLYVNANEQAPFPKVYEIKKKIVDTLEEYRYGKNDMPEGDLDKKPSEAEDIRFIINMSKPSRIYLRGYTASELKDNQWETIDYEKYAGEREGMFQAYIKNGFHPFSQLDTYYSILYGSQEDVFEIGIKNVSASTKYEWIPYGINIADVENMSAMGRIVKDEYVRGNNDDNSKTYMIRNYDYDALLSEKNDDIMKNTSEEATHYRSAEADYMKFVKENYGTEGAGVTQNLAKLCIELRKNLAIKGRENKWNSMNYASEGVNELRKYGYSARYVEGYYIDGREYHDDALVEVRASNAHAWAEVYKEKVGYVPVELTPGFYDELIVEDQTDNINEQNAISQLEGISTDKEKEENSEIDWRKYVYIILLLLGIIIVCFVIFVLINIILTKKRRKAAFASDMQMVRLKMLSSYMLLIYNFSHKKESDMPGEYCALWNKFWFSTDGNLEEEEEERLFAYMKDIRNELFNNAFILKKIYYKLLL